jgi:uncharacterized protein
VDSSVSATPTPSPKLAALLDVIRPLGSVLVCYSGGIDSALVAAATVRALGAERVVAMTAVGPSLADFEEEEARVVAAQIGVRHELVASNEIEDPGYVENGADRCFYCKSELYRLSAVKQVEWSLAHVANGTNLDDLGDHRPGLEAARRAGVRSPLVEAQLTKADVRQVAAELGVTAWNKPAAACLSSRIPYGTKVTRERLGQIEHLEGALKRLGLAQVRVRWHSLGGTDGSTRGVKDGSMARVEVARDELAAAFDQRDAIVQAGKAAGFAFVTLDLAGYRTGSANELLDGRSLRVLS